MKKIITFLSLLLFSFFANTQTTIILTSVPNYTVNDAHIFIAGNFNGWNAGDANFELQKNAKQKYQIKMSQSLGTNIEFKFTLGSWNTVEKGANNEEISNRTLTIGNDDTLYFSVANWANNTSNSTASENVEILTDSFYIPQLDRYRTIRLYLPKDYNTSSVSYPVIYMHDGQNLFDDATSFSGEWHVDESLNSLIEQEHQPVIVVGIDNGGAERINELTPWANETYGGGDGDKYVNFIIETLKPYIDQNFRTLPDRQNTTIWGSSLGGLISLYAILKYPETFGKAGVFSPSLWFNDRIYSLAAISDISYKNKIYFLAGGKEGDGSVVPNCQRLIDTLKDNNYYMDSIEYKAVPSGTHSESFWSSEFSDAFKWLFSKQNYIDKTGSLWIFPNPTNDIINIYSNKENVQVFYQIVDSKGNIFKSDSFVNLIQLDLSSIPNGVYVFNSFTSEETFINHKIIISK